MPWSRLGPPTSTSGAAGAAATGRSSDGELEAGGPSEEAGGTGGGGDMRGAVGGGTGAAGGMLLFGGILAAAFASAVVGEVGCWVGVGETEMGRVGGELEAARGCGLLLRLRAPAEFEPGVTASNAEPNPDGRLYGEKRWPLRPCRGEVGEWPE
uniref:Uncharacterized protein n=1 Tax=Anopheles farauti TaxID=69004 RepID=A0A182Q962_9DIPT